MFWPVFIGVAVLITAYVLYRLLPEIIDFEMSFLWIVAAFLIIYVGAAFYLSRSLPAFGQSNEIGSSAAEGGTAEITVPDRIVK